MKFPQIMGVVNTTPDSFSDGGEFLEPVAAVAHALELVEQGANIVDIGGQSTRPGAIQVSEDEELQRVLPVVEQIRRENSTISISIDTMRSQVAAEALAAGATMVNDVSAGTFDSKMFDIVSKNAASMVLMHMQGEPRTMQDNPTYTDVVEEVATYLTSRVAAARTAGVSNVFVDPGIGFGKTLEHNVALLRNINRFAEIAPVVLGISRKRFLGAITGIDQPQQRDTVTAFVHALMINSNVHTIRVHNVELVAQLRRIAEHL